VARPLFGATREDTWRLGDTPWTVCARNLSLSGYPDVPTLYDALIAANPGVQNWSRLAEDSVVLVPIIPQGGYQ